MAITLFKSQPIRDLSGGVISNVADIKSPPNVSREAINFHFDKIGRATQRGGTTKLGATVESGQTCTGLFNFINAAGTTNRLIAGFNASAYAYNGSTWSSVRSSLDGTPIRMASFADKVIMVGGGAAPAASSGGAFADDALITNMPTTTIVGSFKERVYCAGNSDNPDRLYRSTIISTAGTITWNTTTQYIDINPEDDNNLTGFAVIADYMLLFKKYSMYRFNGNSVSSQNAVQIGAPSQEAITTAKGIVFFFSTSPLGIFITVGGTPQEISQPVADWLEAIPASRYASIALSSDSNHVYVSIGDVTRNGRNYTNIHIVYTISSQVWAIDSYADEFYRLARYIDTSGNVTLVGGDTDGDVQTLNSGTTDNTSPIQYEYSFHELEYDSRGTLKTVSDVALYLQNGAGAFLTVSEDGKPHRNIAQAKDNITIKKGLDIRGNYFTFKVSGQNRTTPVILDGMEVITAHTHGFIENS